MRKQEGGDITKRAISVQLHPELSDLLQTMLDKHQIEMNICLSLTEARRAMLRENYCLAVIDCSTQTDKKAIETIADFRLDTYAPIVSVNSPDATEKILNAGADASFSVTSSPELVALHAIALMRRYTLYNLYDERKPGDAVLHRGALMIDPIRHQVTLANEEIHLQPREFRLLLHFARNPGIVVTPDRICETVWQNGYDRSRDVTAVIAELRRKLGDTKGHSTYIETIHGFGYRFLPQT